MSEANASDPIVLAEPTEVAVRVQCSAFTPAGTQCSLIAQKGRPHCHVHRNKFAGVRGRKHCTTVYLRVDQLVRLQELSGQYRVTAAELMRQGIDLLFRAIDRGEAIEAAAEESESPF